jgi:peptide/nickel transport system substrate-binding protein
VARQQLEAAGFKIDLQVLDWATLLQRRGKPELYEVFSTGHPVSFDPVLFSGLQCDWPGWWCHEDKEQWMAAMARETDARKRKAMWDKVQHIFYEDVGRVKLGDFFGLDAVRKEVHGYRVTNEMNLWNVWLK